MTLPDPNITVALDILLILDGEAPQTYVGFPGSGSKHISLNLLAKATRAAEAAQAIWCANLEDSRREGYWETATGPKPKNGHAPSCAMTGDPSTCGCWGSTSATGSSTDGTAP